MVEMPNIRLNAVNRLLAVSFSGVEGEKVKRRYRYSTWVCPRLLLTEHLDLHGRLCEAKDRRAGKRQIRHERFT